MKGCCLAIYFRSARMIATLLLLFGCFFVHALGQGALGCKKTLKLGVGEPWPPFVFGGPNNFSGIDIDITRLVFSKLNYCLEFIKLPSSARGLQELKKGEIDFLNAASFNEDRATIGLYSIPYRSEAMRIFYHVKNKQKFRQQTLYDLLHQDFIGVVNLGAYYGPEFEAIVAENTFSKQITSVPSVEQRMKMLEQHHVDFVIEDIIPGRYYIQQKQKFNIEMLPIVVHDNPIYFLFSRKTISQEQVNQLNQVIMQSQADIDAVVDNYIF
ncbi:hypothetical protein D1819_02710 [Pseudoalteromonas tunicata]|jgi:polar amino acid transport system substrate-binding protein|nr:hypothetical protein D1819_02710 [Pseudoalteromonas tunicata]